MLRVGDNPVLHAVKLWQMRNKSSRACPLVADVKIFFGHAAIFPKKFQAVFAVNTCSNKLGCLETGFPFPLAMGAISKLKLLSSANLLRMTSQ